MKIFKITAFLVFALFIVLISCNKSSPFGSELFEGDQIKSSVTGDFQLTVYSQVGDSAKTHSPFVYQQLSSYLCGDFQDPIFGESVSSIYAQIGKAAGEINFTDAELDSVIFVLPFDSKNIYGDTNQIYGIELYEVIEEMDFLEDYYSNHAFLTDQKIGDFSFYPKPNTKVSVITVSDNELDTLELSPQLRIKMDDDFSQAFFTADTSIFESDSTFTEFFKGIHIKPSTTNAGMLSFNLTSGEAGIRVYYHVDTVLHTKLFQTSIYKVKSTNFAHNHEGSLVEPFLNDPSLGDSLIFVQGMEGIDGIIEITGYGEMKNKIINKVELNFTVETFPEDNTELYPPIEQIIISEVTDTTFRRIDDVLIAQSKNGLVKYFGGNPVENEPTTYTVNITAYFKSLLEGNVYNKIAITPEQKYVTASRVVLHGPGHPQSPVELRVIYSDY